MHQRRGPRSNPTRATQPSRSVSHVPHTSLAGRVAPWLAAAFIALCLTNIPFGTPLSRNQAFVLGAIGVGMLGYARAAVQTWDRLTLWPVIILLAAYAVGCSTSADAARSISRFTTMPLFAMIFIAIQLAATDRVVLRTVLWTGVITMLAVVLDVSIARATGRSLFHDEAVSLVRTAGSQGNPNDLSAVSLLLPLAWAAVPRRGRVAWYLGFAIAAALAWVLSAGRQVAIGWAAATLVPIMMQLGWKRSAWIILPIAGLAGAVIVMDPILRTRMIETLENGFGDRKPLIVFGLWQWWQQPWLGNGPGTFGELYLRAAAANWSWRGLTLEHVGMPWVHNLGIEVLCDLGLVGAAAFGVVVLGAWRKIRSALVSGPDGRALAIAACAMAVSILVIGTVDLTFIKDWFRCVFWLALGLAFLPPEQPVGPARLESPPKRL